MEDSRCYLDKLDATQEGDLIEKEEGHEDFDEIFSENEKSCNYWEIKKYYSAKDLGEILPLSGIESGDIIEIRGKHQSGKTFLTVMCAIKILQNYKEDEVIFFMSSNDCDVPYQLLLKDFGYNEEYIQSILHRFHLYKIHDVEELSKSLNEIHEDKSLRAKRFSFIFIDINIEPYIYSCRADCPIEDDSVDGIKHAFKKLAKEQNKIILFTNILLEISEDEEIEENINWDDITDYQLEVSNEGGHQKVLRLDKSCGLGDNASPSPEVILNKITNSSE